MRHDPTLENEAVKRIFAERKDFIIIGLTGRTGCGCTTVARLLGKSFSELQPPRPFPEGQIDARQERIVYEYSQATWTPFQLIKMENVILTFILEEDSSAFEKWVNSHVCDVRSFDTLSAQFDDLHNERMQWKEEVERHTSVGDNVPYCEELYQFYFVKIPQFCNELKKIFNNNDYTNLIQRISDNIRASGSAYSSDVVPDCILRLSQRVNMLIKMLRRKNHDDKKQVLVVIDAFRNPYEVTFFKDRYSAFYLFAINAVEDERRRRLFSDGMTIDDIYALDQKEYPSLNNTIEDFYQVNIEKTIELADVHINNPYSESRSLSETKKQLIRYTSLIMHPGIVQPTKLERCMQVAYDCKLNSGCLSRQVGAVISDSECNIVATGWNSAPSNQIPCTLRSIFSLIRDDHEDEIGMSEFERTNDTYRSFLRLKTDNIDFGLLDGRTCSYCFKDAYNAFRKQKNQVFTRSIHAEEMAFLQAARIGAPKVQGGYLFTTASPCELCSKKACHLGITKIYYIDRYPGISYEHILNCGESSPEMIPFHGAIGRAYTQLYTQVLPYKDELYMLLGLTFKTSVGE